MKSIVTQTIATEEIEKFRKNDFLSSCLSYHDKSILGTKFERNRAVNKGVAICVMAHGIPRNNVHCKNRIPQHGVRKTPRLLPAASRIKADRNFQDGISQYYDHLRFSSP